MALFDKKMVFFDKKWAKNGNFCKFSISKIAILETFKKCKKVANFGKKTLKINKKLQKTLQNLKFLKSSRFKSFGNNFFLFSTSFVTI